MKALITAPFTEEGISILKSYMEIERDGFCLDEEEMSKEELMSRVGDYEVLIAEIEKIDREIIERGNKLKILASPRGNPTRNIDIKAATEKGIPVFHAPGRNAIAVAELTISMMIAISRMMFKSYRFIQEKKWREDGEMTYLKFRGNELYGKKLGLVGLGAIGERVCRIAEALGMEISIYDPYVDQESLDKIGASRKDLHDIFADSDYVSLHCAVTEETKGLVDAKLLNLMKDNAYLINTARAAIVNEDDLLKVLRENRIAGAALDVFSREPLPPDHPFIDLDNCLLTPHIGGATHEVVNHHSRIVAEGIEKYLQGKEAGNIYNTQVMGD